MSSHIDDNASVSATPKISKKRKSAADTPETSKKKRRHDKVENGLTASQDTTSSKKSKEKRKRVRDEVADEILPEVPEIEEVQAADISMRSASPAPEPMVVDAGHMNGVDTAVVEDEVAETDDTLLQSQEPSCFYEKRVSLQVPIPAVSLASPTSSILALHLAPLLLTYFPPADGIVLSFSDPVLSAKSSHGVNLPLKTPTSGTIPRYPSDETFARCADGFGVCWVWLTATFLVFRPQRGDSLKGWSNVSSEGFIGLVSYNYFQTSIGKTRIPNDWTWDGPTKETRKNKKTPKKGKLRDEDSDEVGHEYLASTQDTVYTDDIATAGSGAFVDADGHRITSSQTFQVADVEMVPGHERDRWTFQINGSLLSPDEEAAVIAEERGRFERIQHRSRSRSKTPALEPGGVPLMSGAVAFSRAGSIV